jgi:hypothetical protein
LKWISLKLESENEHANYEHTDEELHKMTIMLNREIYKKENERLKNLMNSWDNNALLQYSELVSKAKKSWIK